MTRHERTATELFNELEEFGLTDEHGHNLAQHVAWTELRRRVEDRRDSTYTVEDGWIELNSGTRFHYRDPDPGAFLITDIANALGKVCRYAGHVHTFYSVAEHSCLMMRWAREHLCLDRRTLRTILMHDRAEAYIPDLPRPLKHMMPQFKALEADLEAASAPVFNVLHPLPSVVKELDTRILRDEREQAMNPSGNNWGTDDFEPLGVELHFWSPGEAIDNFLGDYAELSEK